MKEKIINILKQFEQRDYKKGGVSIAPEMYDAIANKIVAELPANEVIKSTEPALPIQNVSIALSGFMDWLWLNHNILTNADNNKIALEKYLATL